jgi:hypothetical protein
MLSLYKTKNGWDVHGATNHIAEIIARKEYGIEIPEEEEKWVEFLNGDGGALYLASWRAVNKMFSPLFAGRLPQAVEYEEEKKKGNKIKKIIGSAALAGVLLTALAYASSKTNQKPQPTTITDATKDSNNDGLPDLKAIELGLNPNKTYPIIGKAYQMGFNDSILKELTSLNNSAYGYNLTEKRVDFLKTLTSFPSHQLEFLKWVMKDGKITQEEYEQAKFLASLSEEEFEKAAKSNLLNNTNWDKDIWTNYVEKFLTKTDYLTPNNLYLLSFDVITPPLLRNYIVPALLESGVNKNNILSYVNENATYTNFKFAVDKIASLAKENDIVLISLNSHGWKDGIGFSDEVKLYSDIAKDIEKIKSTRIIVISACQSGGALKYFHNTSKTVIITSTDENKAVYGFAIGNFFPSFYKHYKEYSFYWKGTLYLCPDPYGKFWYDIADKDGNGYISVLEAFEISKNSNPEENPQIMNPELAKNLYLIGTHLLCGYNCVDSIYVCEKSEEEI